ncbi:YbaB/EbfC family nucleoid-associated protein [Nocardioides jejuensis]|uniref:Nucleoid-associated protein EPD65_13980 n=1 Tax=Nocardioides jejuensis TaxID=2502782 RepID=A0A4R1BVZ2_9ACTN|nr:YbaB/EbfC family nucleoid-associated protein [Nocardioides jejuensis]
MQGNPFGAEGGFDMAALLQQAQQMKDDLAIAQEALANAQFEGTVAGGAVTATVNGHGDLLGVQIKAGEVDGSNPDELADLGDMIVAAYRDAKAKADATSEESIGMITGGLSRGMGF